MRCFASTPAAPLLFIYLLPRSWPPYFPPIPRLLAHNLELGLWPGLGFRRSTGSGACSDSWLCSCFAPARARALAQGFGHHLPSLPSAKLLALASRWPLLLAPTSRRSIPARQFASTSLQSSWTMIPSIVEFHIYNKIMLLYHSNEQTRGTNDFFHVVIH